MVISEYALTENGIDLLRYIRSRHGEIPFILLTSHSDGEIAAEASRFGISAYFIKKGRFDTTLLRNLWKNPGRDEKKNSSRTSAGTGVPVPYHS